MSLFHSVLGIELRLLASTSIKLASTAGRNARPDEPPEYKPENIVIPEALIARPREPRVIWNFILNAKPAEPAIRKVTLDYATER